MSKIGIVGYGWVGKAMHGIFPDAVIYDPHLGLGTKEDINDCHVAFIGVPTPNMRGGWLDSSIVEEIVKWCEADLIVIRSTLQPGTADKLTREYHRNIVVQPEYLGETVAHPLLEEGDRPFMVIGGWPASRRRVIEIYQEVYNANINIRQVTALEAEVIKLSENRAIAFKVAQCQELYDVCEKAGVDYYTVREAVYGDDPRFNLWWTFVYPEKRGFDSKCIPKDIYAWAAWAETLGYDPKVTNAILRKNKEYIGG